MIDLYIIIAIVIFGFLISQMTCVAYVKALRTESKNKMTPIQVIAICFLLGGPALLLSYISPEIRIEDISHRRMWLICGIISTLIEILVIVLLFIFNVVKY